MAGKPKVSILTAHRDSPDVLVKLATALESQTLDREVFEWIVVDDGSIGGAPELLNSYDGPLTLRSVVLKENTGRSAVRNLALREASGEIIVLLDADTLPWPNCLQVMVDRVLESGSVVIGRRDPHPELPNDALTRYLNSRGATKHRDGDQVPGKYFFSSLSAMPKSMLESVNGFDESYKAWGGEDLDLGIRLENAGVKFYFADAARAWHHHWRSWDEIEEMYRVYGRSGVYELLNRHHDPSRYLGLDRLLPVSRRGSVKEKLLRLTTQTLLKPAIYTRLSWLVRKLPMFPWPDLIFDYLLFYLYTRELRTTGHSVLQ